MCHTGTDALLSVSQLMDKVTTSTHVDKTMPLRRAWRWVSGGYKRCQSFTDRIEAFILAQFFGTVEFEARYKERIDDEVAAGVKRFLDLPDDVFDPEAKSQLLASIKYHVRRFSAFTVWWRHFSRTVIYFAVSLPVSFLLYWPFIWFVNSRSQPISSHTWWAYFLDFVYSLLGMRLLAFDNKFRRAYRHQLPESIAASWGLVTAAVSFIFFYYSRRLAHSLPFLDVLSIVFSYTALGSTGFVAAALGWMTSTYLSLRMRDSRYPDSVIVTKLISLISSLEGQEGNQGYTLSSKRDIILDLEEMALCFLTYIPDCIGTHNPEILDWQRQMFAKVASAVRDTERWVILPKTDTKGPLTDRLQDLALLYCCWRLGRSGKGRTRYH